MANNEKILVVDDDKEMLSALSEALERSGFSVDSAPDGESALSKFESGDFSIIVTDIDMPRKNGLELLKDVKKISPKTPVIIITADDNSKDSAQATENGADDYLLKPFTSSDLEKSIKALLGSDANGDDGTAKISSITKSAGKGKEIITQDPKLLEMLDIIDRTAASTASILIHGESGTGKELIARYIHQKSDRANGPFVAVNCAALPEALLESELFGHEKGAFTGAISKKMGKFELADGGTILLDEITEMQIELQAKLLRVLQEKEVDRVGGTSPIPINVRVVATTNRSIDNAIKGGHLREDLYFRLNVIPIDVPALRERINDIPVLINHFVQKFSKESGKNIKTVSADTMEILKKCKWKGNIRELENVMERAVLLCRGDSIKPNDLFLSSYSTEEPSGDEPFKFDGTLENMEKKMILGTLEKVGDNRTKAANLLGISIRTLRNKLNIYKDGEAVEE